MKGSIRRINLGQFSASREGHMIEQGDMLCLFFLRLGLHKFQLGEGHVFAGVNVTILFCERNQEGKGGGRWFGWVLQ